MNNSMYSYILPVVGWAFFFIFSTLIMTDRVEVTGFKIFLVVLFFLIGFMSSLANYGRSVKK